MRNISEDNNTVYRVVTTHVSGRKEYEGPYATIGSAKGRATSLSNNYWDTSGAVRSVQKMTGEWEEA